jgi:hypothetical protein
MRKLRQSTELLSKAPDLVVRAFGAFLPSMRHETPPQAAKNRI